LILSKSWAVKLLQSTGHLFSSSKQECLACKQQAVLDREKHGLCDSCYWRIPWIHQVLCPICGRYESCRDCARRGIAFFSRSRSAVMYDDGMKELLARYKYRGDERLGRAIGAMLVHAFRLLQMEPSTSTNQSAVRILTYVPVSERRMLERGFNQAEQMAKEVGKAVNLPVIPLLQRKRHTDKQSFKSRSQRIEDLEHVFELHEAGLQQVLDLSQKDEMMQIYIVDDVYTTGSKLNQCSMVLKKGLNCDVFGLIWAR
jgi:competence protein ComFC